MKKEAMTSVRIRSSLRNELISMKYSMRKKSIDAVITTLVLRNKGIKVV